MELRRNILSSLVIHAIIIIAILTVSVSGRDMTERLDADYLIVSLFKEIRGNTSIESQNTKKNEDKILPPPFPPPRGGRVREGVYKDKIASPEPTLSRKIASTDFVSLAMTSEGARNDTPANPSDTDVILESSKASTAISASRITGQMPSEEFIAKSQSGDKIPDNTKGGSGKDGTDSIYAFIRSAIEKVKTFPSLARKKRIEGTVITGFTINSKGYPQDIKIKKSSGHEILDSEAIKIVKNSAPLPYVRDEIIVPITFKLTDSASYAQK